MNRFPIHLRQSGNGLRAGQRRALYRAACDWHDGQGSALYSLLSTNQVRSMDHLEDIVRELQDCDDLNAVVGSHALEAWKRDYLDLVHICN